MTEEDLEAVARELVRQAREGNLAAAKLLLSYTLGKPAAAVDPDTLDLHEWALYRQAPDAEQELAARQTQMPLALACEYARAATEAMTIAARHKLSDELHAWEAEQQAKQRRAARRREQAERRKQEKAAPPAAPQAPLPSAPPAANPVPAQARALLAQLLAQLSHAAPAHPTPPPSANGGGGANGRPHPPSANGKSHDPGPDRGGPSWPSGPSGPR